MTNILGNILKGKVVIVGVGNTLRRDDGLGPALIQKLQGKTEALCLDTGTAPENFIGKIVKENPDTILIVDALHLGLPPGEYAVLKKDEIAKGGLSTHDISPNMFIDYLQKQTAADIYMLGVEPKDLSFGQEMSASVEKAVAEIAQIIIKEIKCTRRI